MMTMTNRILAALTVLVLLIFAFYGGMRWEKRQIAPVLAAWRQQADNASPLVRQWRMQYEACVKSKGEEPRVMGLRIGPNTPVTSRIEGNTFTK